MALQTETPVYVYNGPDLQYQVATKANADGSFTQLVGFDSDYGDAFGRLRVSDPFTLFEASFTYDLQPLWFETVQTTSGTVAHDTDSRSAILTADATSGSLAAIQSRNYFPYEKGKSQLVKITFELGAGAENVRKRVGYFDSANGFYLEQSGESIDPLTDDDGVPLTDDLGNVITDGLLSMVRRSTSTGSLVETVIPQASWNIDPLDGSGPSGVAIDITKAQILVIDGQWLGVGRVRMGFNIDGVNYYAHEFLHANREAVAPYTQTFSLPTRWEVESTAASAGSTLQAICCEVESEGGVSSPNGYQFAAANVTDVSTSTTRVHLLSIRPTTEFPAASGQTNRTFTIPGDISLIVASNPCLVEVFYGSTLTGGTWTRANDNSAIEYGVGQTIATAGVPVDSFFAAAASGNTRAALGGSIDSQYPLTLSIAGDAPQALTIAATTISGNGTARAGINWKEIR